MKDLFYAFCRVLLMPFAIIARRSLSRMLLAALSRDHSLVFPLTASVFFLGEEEHLGRTRTTYIVLVTNHDEKTLARYRCTIVEKRGKEHVLTERADDTGLPAGEEWQIAAQSVPRFHVIDDMSWRRI